nr:DNA/RNA helicase domain-containing protein [Corynebacterium amycolatum]
MNVLLTRGVHGLYIYAVDEELREKLLSVSK